MFRMRFGAEASRDLGDLAEQPSELPLAASGDYEVRINNVA